MHTSMNPIWHCQINVILKKVYRIDTFCAGFSYALEFNIVSLYTIDTAGSNLEKQFNETNMTVIMTSTLWISWSFWYWK